MKQNELKNAVIIGNGDLGILFNKKINLLNFDYCLVLDSAITNYHLFETKKNPDGLLGDFDRAFDAEIWQKKYNNLEIIHTPDQEKTDFEKGIEFLLSKNITQITGLGLTGKRMDHTFNNISSLAKYNDAVAIELLDEYSKIYCIDQYKSFKKMLAQQTIVSLLPIGKVEGITTKNLAYNLENEDLELGVRTGSSNAVIQTDFVEITITKGKLIIMECKD
ncbi:thiamine diphosphokinase [Flavobacterium agricola]|uniref:Thiamine diphosphokinase n=1 Tax=Flavobacterium agricola TaxID=2870839 RepID=A0ABY6LZR8_9FLAO|nr:thiamine diphosphokinase [Flavobacterium agricola]UYW01517.1 thiamine diphosphokinase [Flavobacterium agricola]